MKNIILLFSVLVLVCSSLDAKDTELLQNKANTEYSDKLINRFENALNANPDPSNPNKNDITSLLYESVQNQSILSKSAKDYVESLQDAFSDLEYEYESPSGFFRYHFSENGTDAISFESNDGDEIPDLLQFYDSCFTYAKNNFLAAGYPLPAINHYYEIYISSAACRTGVLGFASPNSLITDNPNTTEKENRSYQSYICIRSNFNNFGSDPEEYVKNTSCHEFFHAIQFGIDCGGSLNMFVMEGCAVWSQNWNYPDSYMSSMYLYQYFDYCDMQLNYQPISSDDNDYIRPYGTWVFFRYLTEMYGDDIIKKLYYNHINSSQNEAFEKTLKVYGTDYQTVIKNFMISQFIMPDDVNHKPIYWPLSEFTGNYLKPNLEYTFNLAAQPVVFDNQTSGNLRFEMLSADYLKINHKSGSSITISNKNVTDTLVMVVIQADAEINPVNFEYQEIKVSGKKSGSIKLDYDTKMPFMSIAIINIKKANYKGQSTYYTLKVVPDPIPELSVNDNSDNFNIRGFSPMPVSGISILNLDTKLNSDYSFSIYNIDGKLIEKGNFVANSSSNQIPFDFNNYSRGIYLIQVTSQNTAESKSYNFIVK